LKFTEGTPAVVEEYTEDSPLEGIFVLTIDSIAVTDSAVATCENAAQETVTESYKLTTTAGETIFVTVEAGTKPINERELGDLVVGEKAYRYCATKANREIRASYLVQNDADEHKYLEESLKTLTFTQ
jgi:hypothetical protein